MEMILQGSSSLHMFAAAAFAVVLKHFSHLFSLCVLEKNTIDVLTVIEVQI